MYPDPNQPQNQPNPQPGSQPGPQPGPQPFSPPAQPQQPGQPQQPAPQYQPPTAYPVDYLNEIAPKKAAAKLGMKLKIFMAAAIGLVLLIVVLSFAMSGRGLDASSPQLLAAKLDSLSKIVKKSQQNLQTNTIRSNNSDLQLVLSNTTQSITAPLESHGVKMQKLDKNYVKAVAAKDATLEQRLEDARLNAIFDETYSREMAYEIKTLMVQMQSIYTKTSDKALAAALAESFKNLGPIQEVFAKYTDLPENVSSD
ncbi:MAG: hypothetical protein L0H36_01390 [bacterium]|nr:hypothetical protein [bacterium]MDN5835270.1 hypothetical protein [bacterium]